MCRRSGKRSGAEKMSKQRQADANPQSDRLTQEAKEQYEQLVREVRMRQHELGNQLSAAKTLSSGEASQYLEELNRDQRYNVLLLCGDPLLAGLLYQKCKEAEAQGIRVESHISARLEAYALPQHDLIAIVGGLLDNAIDAELSRPGDERNIRILVDREDGQYRITVANRFPYVPYETMHSWFRAGHTSKGMGRGLGLAHAREICADGRADIAYGNQETDGDNEVFFMLYLKPPEETESAGESVRQDIGEEYSLEKTERLIGFGMYAGIAGIAVAMSLLIFVIVPSKDQGLSQDLPQDETYIAEASDIPANDAQASDMQAGTQVSVSRPFTLYDVGEAPEGGQEIERPDESFWHPCSFFPTSVALAKIQYETYDAQGNHIARDTYIPRWNDSSKDRGVLVKLGKEYWNFDGYCRRLQEYWTYNETGQAVSYRSYKQYGAGLERQLYEEINYEPQTDNTGNADGIPQEVLAAQKNEDMTCDWDAELRRAHITETDYYGEEHQFIYDYDAQGRKTRGYSIQDNVAQLIYEAYFDDKGRVKEIDDNTPRLIKERLADKYRENFYDEALTQPLRPRQSENRYQFYFYNTAEDSPAYMLNIDAQEGDGGLYVYQYDAAGQLLVTYLYYIQDAYLGEFSLDTPEGGCLYFSDSHEEYYTYEKTGLKWLEDRYFVTEIAMEDASGRLAWTFSFDKGYPALRKEGDSVVDWTEVIDQNILSEIQ